MIRKNFAVAIESAETIIYEGGDNEIIRGYNLMITRNGSQWCCPGTVTRGELRKIYEALKVELENNDPTSTHKETRQ